MFAKVFLLREDFQKLFYIFYDILSKGGCGLKHGHLLKTAYKLSATKIEHSPWSIGHGTQL